MGISSVFSTISLLGFLAFLAGIGLVVVAASQGRPVRGGVLLAAVGLVFGVVLSVVAQGVIVVEPQERAVVFETISGDLGTPREPGTHIIIPVLQTATLYNVAQQQYTMSGQSSEGQISGNDAVRARTLDGQEVFMDITILYRLDPTGVNTVHRNLERRYEEDFIRPTSRGVAREVTGGFTAQGIYGEERAELENEMQQRISDLMAEQGLTLVDLLIRDITFSEDFTAAIEQAQVAEQEAERARRRIQQIEAEADQDRAEARGDRDAAILRAEGEAEATILQAQAEAEALRLVSEQIAANPSLIQYEYVRRLSQNVNIALVPSNSPFLFDFESLAEGDVDFEAPEVPEPEEIVPEAPEGSSEGDGGGS